MPESTAPTTPATSSPGAARTPGRGIPPLLTVALVLADLSALCLVAVLVAAAGGHVLWRGVTLFPAVVLPVAFLLVCLQLLRGARRRSVR
ncbi:hypothetical protein [Kocuria rhizophila]|uniref:hypothetical protein n=1 Tax=Kocuria rhizophila TaxID=72000 RepID=UPI001DACC18F|nr:hypothetical protein [Kocuria rhizophila]MCC5672801.1 hypothetical protein [Kocuria rhizophila]